MAVDPPPSPPDPTAGAGTGGHAADHPGEDLSPVLVSPTDASDHNTVRMTLFPVACWRVDDLRFAFGSSFPSAGIAKELGDLRALIEAHPGAPASIFGHADPVGTDVYNKQLSGRRATAVYALLTRDVAMWEDLYQDTQDWGPRTVEEMLLALGHDPGRIDGEMDDQAHGAIKDFQQKNGLAGDGIAGPVTRKKLFQAYMDLLCGAEFKLDKHKDFLAQGTDTSGKGDFQGCGEFNPVLMLAQPQMKEFDKPENHLRRNAEYGPDRRVVIFLFRPGSRVDPQRWPCPRAKEGVAGCKKRFWSDAARRREPGDQPREFGKTQDTFACRFYQRIAGDSPCERQRARAMDWLSITVLDVEHQALPHVSYQLAVGERSVRSYTDGKGRLSQLVPRGSTQGTLEMGGQRFDLTIEPLPPVEEIPGLQVRLRNLGYDCGTAGEMNPETQDSLRQFQELHKLTVDGEANAETQAKLKEVYGH